MFRRKRKEINGLLYVTKPEPGYAPELFLSEVDNPEDLAKKKYVTFEVRVISNPSQQ